MSAGFEVEFGDVILGGFRTRIQSLDILHDQPHVPVPVLKAETVSLTKKSHRK